MNDARHKWVNEMKGVLETLNQGVIINDDRKRIVFANRLFLKMIGIPAAELLGVTITDLYPPEDAAVLQKHIERRKLEGQSQYEFYLPQKGGGKLPVLVTARQIEDPEGNVFAGDYGHGHYRAEARGKCAA